MHRAERERGYYGSVDPSYYGGQNAHNRTVFTEDQDNGRRREYSTMTEENDASRRSVTPFVNRENPGKSLLVVQLVQVLNPRIHIVVMIAAKKKGDSEYIRKKSNNRRLEKIILEIKEEIDSKVYDDPRLKKYDIDTKCIVTKALV
uniref:Alba domain-containing protein n=1 Tax=Caenorhabditis tropicalis TaxID=1561998 RepID=A0A1I7TBS9_9PELO